MPNNTINFALPYPAPSDAPCDFDEQWCEFTAALDGVFATFQAGVDRTNPVIPLAVMRRDGPVSLNNLNKMPFDTVVADTAGMTDIDADPYHITVVRPGRYTISANMEMPSPAVAANSQISLLIDAPSTIIAGGLDRGAGPEYRLNATNPVHTVPSGTKISLLFNFGSTALFVINRYWLSVAWHSDTERPS
jgi:hypothetical protein